MRKSYSTQLRLDSLPIDQVELNFGCRDSIIPVLRSLQHVYSKPDLTETIMQLVGRDINGETTAKRGREGMDYWHILVLASVRLGCNYTYDQVHDLSENHIKLRAIMGLGSWDEQTKFKWQKIRDNVCRLEPQTIDEISRLVVSLGHEIDPEAIKKLRADSFVMPYSNLIAGISIIPPRVRSFATACERCSICVPSSQWVTAFSDGDSMTICGIR